MVQGKVVVQAPLFETNVRPAGVGSVTVMFDAVSELLLSSAIWSVIWLFEFAFCGPLLLATRSMLPPVASGVVAVEAWLAPFASSVELLPFAVLLIEPPL